jgi:hypothetical protein
MSLTLIDPPAPPRESRTIRLTPAQFDQLDAAIERARATDEPVETACLYTLMVCITDVQVCVVGPKLEGRIEYLDDGDVRLVHPTLEQLLDVRRTALLRT